MNSKTIWSDQIPGRDGAFSSVVDIAVSAIQSRVLVAAGNRVLLYNAENGDLIDSLRGHKDSVLSVSFSSDGTRFSSGGADNVVVIWKISGQGLLKYNHQSPIQKVAYNPTTLLLASCSEMDFGFWTPEQKQVSKEKVPSRILSAAWSNDGSMLALGLLNGLITIRNIQGQEIHQIERRAPVWCLAFIPDTSPPSKPQKNAMFHNAPGNAGLAATTENNDALAVGCWDKSYCLYRIHNYPVKDDSSSKPTLFQHRYSNNLVKVQHEKSLKFYPCSITYSANVATKSSYLIVTGSNKKATLYSREGSKLMEIAQKDSWVWCCDGNGDNETVVIGSHVGTVDYMKVNLERVHSLFKDRFTYRENLTEVIVQHLVTDKKVRMKMKDLVTNVSVYKDKLAVQLGSNRVCVYESNPTNLEDMHFRIRKEKIEIKDLTGDNPNHKSHLAITSQHLVFANGKVIELYTFSGQRQKVWSLDAVVTFLRVDGGPEGREGLLVGLKNGAALKLYVNNPFPVELTKMAHSVVQLDVNVYRTVIAVVDTSNTLTLTDLRSQTVLFTSPDVVSACFNTEVQDLICMTNVNNSISVLTLSSGAKSTQGFGEDENANVGEVQEQHIQGWTLGFRGQKIFCLNRTGVMGVDVPQGYNIQRALEGNKILTAYKIACLGATEVEWKLVAMRALRANHLSIAKNAFARLKNVKFLALIDTIERRSSSSRSSAPSLNIQSASQQPVSGTDGKRGGRLRNAANETSSASAAGTVETITPPLDFQWHAELMAYEGHHHEAAKIYARNNKLDEAIRLFTDMKLWEDAKMFARNAGQSDVTALTMQQAKWLQEVKDWKGSAEMLLSMGQYLEAAKSIGEHRKQDAELTGWQDALIEVVRLCPVENEDVFQYCGELYSSLNEVAYAKETYEKAKDVSKLMALYAKQQMWSEAGALADEHEGKIDVSIFLSYAEWLVSQDRYEDAMVALKKAKRIDLSRKLIEELTENAVTECRFKDAAYYYWMLSKEIEQEMIEKTIDSSSSSSDSSQDESINAFKEKASRLQYEYEHKADLYFAYANVHAFATDPFTSLQPEMIFQVSRFIINSLGNAETMPEGISKTNTVYTLAKQAMALGAFKLARDAYDRLSKLQIPAKRLEEVEIDMLLVQAKPMRDNPDHLPVCYRCSMPNPLLNPFTNKFAKGDVCTNCGHPFVRSFINFDVLPLVEFVPDPSITDEEAIDMIRQQSGDGFYQSSSKSKDRAEGKSDGKEAAGWRESKHEGADVLKMDSDEIEDETEDAVNEALGVNAGEQDVFTRCVNLTLERQKGSYTPVKVDASTLAAIKRNEVYVCRPSSKTKRATFYRNMLPDIPIAISQPCHRFFHLEDFEFAYLSEQKCPYSRLKNVGEYGSL